MIGPSLRRVLHLGVKELISLARDPVLVTFMAYAFTLAVTMSVNQAVELRNAPIAVVDDDRSALSGRIVAGFLGPRFQPARLIDARAVEPALESGRYTFVVAIPARFARDVARGRQPVIQVSVDGSAVAQALAGTADIERIVVRTVGEFIDQSVTESESPRVTIRIRYNNNLESAWFLSVGELLMMVTVLGIVLPAVALMRDRDRGTMGHLLVTPLSPGEIMFAKLWANGVIVLVGAVASLILVVNRHLGVPITGSVWLFALATAVYQLAAMAIGLAVATVVRTVPQFVMVLLLIVAPMIFLSGVFTPAESLPPAMAAAMRVLPLRYYVDVATSVLFRGARLSEVARSIGIILALAILLLLISHRRFRAHLAARFP